MRMCEGTDILDACSCLPAHARSHVIACANTAPHHTVSQTRPFAAIFSGLSVHFEGGLARESSLHMKMQAI